MTDLTEKAHPCGGEAADLGAGSGVQQCEQAGESLVRVSRAACPSPEQRPLGGGIKNGAGKGRLAAQPEDRGRVDEDELACFAQPKKPRST